MFQVKNDHIYRADTREIFYNIPSTRNIISARQILFIGKVVRYPLYDRPSKMILTASCNHLRIEQGGCPEYHNKYNLVRNLCLLFKKVHEVHIYPWNGTLKDCINEASDEIYRNHLIRCPLKPSLQLPAWPETWNRQRQRSRNRTWTIHAPPPTPPSLWRK